MYIKKRILVLAVLTVFVIFAILFGVSRIPGKASDELADITEENEDIANGSYADTYRKKVAESYSQVEIIQESYQVLKDIEKNPELDEEGLYEEAHKNLNEHLERLVNNGATTDTEVNQVSDIVYTQYVDKDTMDDFREMERVFRQYRIGIEKENKINSIKIGMSQDEVQAILGEPDTTESRPVMEGGEVVTWYYYDFTVMFRYDEVLDFF